MILLENRAVLGISSQNWRVEFSVVTGRNIQAQRNHTDIQKHAAAALEI